MLVCFNVQANLTSIYYHSIATIGWMENKWSTVQTLLSMHFVVTALLKILRYGNARYRSHLGWWRGGKGTKECWQWRGRDGAVEPNSVKQLWCKGDRFEMCSLSSLFSLSWLILGAAALKHENSVLWKDVKSWRDCRWACPEARAASHHCHESSAPLKGSSSACYLVTHH